MKLQTDHYKIMWAGEMYADKHAAEMLCSPSIWTSDIENNTVQSSVAPHISNDYCVMEK